MLHYHVNVTLFPVATVTQTAGRCRRQLIHVESPTVPDPNVCRPKTALVWPMETHSAWHNPLSRCRMSASQPTWRMRITATLRHTRISHLIACKTSEPIPGFNKRSVTLCDCCWVALRTIITAQSSVASTF